MVYVGVGIQDYESTIYTLFTVFTVQRKLLEEGVSSLLIPII
jgi:hypothetical protein